MKIEAIVKYIVVSFLLFANLSCKENKDETLIAKVTDLTEEEEVISDIEYDGDGRIIRYGDTPIVYAGDKVTIGKMDCLHSGNKLCSVTFKMAKGKAIESRTRCLLKRGSETWDVFKTSTYEYGADTLCIKSDYFGVEGNDFLKRVCTKYIFGDDGKLMESITSHHELNDSTYVCHSYYNYDNHINYRANLNIQAYVMDSDGLDGFFYFLLNLGDFRVDTVLPNDIGRCVNHGAETYNVHANYRLDDESPIKIEVLYNYTKLLPRIELSYKSLK